MASPTGAFLPVPTGRWGHHAAAHLEGGALQHGDFIAGLAGISRDLYDAANVDGASWWNRLRYVTLPGMIPALSVVLMLSFIRGFRVFAEVYATTGGGRLTPRKWS